MGSKGGGCQKIGYWYSATVHMIFFKSADVLLAVHADEKVVWKVGVSRPTLHWQEVQVGEEEIGGVMNPIMEWQWVTVMVPTFAITSNSSVNIHLPDLFGGSDRSGGITGNFHVEFGRHDQPKSPVLVRACGNDISAHRGVFGFVLDRMTLTANTPTPKPWSATCGRWSTFFNWQPLLQQIGNDMNPAHIIMDCMTDREWGGLGVAESQIDMSAFANAAMQLSAESFGLSLLWSEEMPIDTFIENVLEAIDGYMFQSITTGKFTLKLARDDYHVTALPIFDTNNIISLETFKQVSQQSIANAVVLEFLGEDEKGDSVTVIDSAGVASNDGIVVTTTRKHYGIRTRELALKVAERELRYLGRNLHTVTFIANRFAYDVSPGDIVRFRWSPHGVDEIILRVIEVDIGSIDDSVIRVDGVTDVFSMSSTVISNPDGGSVWTEPVPVTVDEIQDFVIKEASYTQLSALGLTDGLLQENTFVVPVVFKTLQVVVDFQMHDRMGQGDQYIERVTGLPVDKLFLSIATPAEIYSTLTFTENITLILAVGSIVQVGAELVMVMSFRAAQNEVDVMRGVMDTVPVNHPALTLCHTMMAPAVALNENELLIADQLFYKLLPSNGVDRRNLTDATEHTHNCVGRQGLPISCGNFKINGLSYPIETTAYVDVVNGGNTVDITWSHRNRLSQGADVFPQDGSSFTPETGTTYTVVIFDQNNTLLHSEVGITGESFRYTVPTGLTGLRITIDTLRSGMSSFQKQDWTTALLYETLNLTTESVLSW